MTEKTDNKKLENIILQSLEDIKAQSILCLDVKSLTTVTDQMIICTGSSNRHVKSIADRIVDDVKSNQFRPLSVQDDPKSEWIIVDMGSIIVHIMQAEARDFYDLESLWSVPSLKREQS